jgi:hypothetical protein
MAPTKKWWAALTGGLASVAASWIVTGAFDDVERGMCATLLTALVASYWKENDATAGGVPGAPVPVVASDSLLSDDAKAKLDENP